MKPMIKLGAVAAFGSALLAVGCGDELTTNITEQKTSIMAYETKKDLPKCDSAFAGELALLEANKKVLYCNGESWEDFIGDDGTDGKNGADGKSGADGKDGADGKNGVNGKNGADGEDGADGKDGTSCTAKPIENGVEILCGGEVLGTIMNGAKGDAGANGTDGKNGSNGENGSSCTAEALEDGSGYTLICGGASVGIITNGTNGSNGEKGETGESCSFSDNNEGTITITCGEQSTEIFKAMCGITPYDPKFNVCVDGKISTFCGEVALETGKFCYSGEQYDFCKVTVQLNSGITIIQNTKYNPESQKCNDNNDGTFSVYHKCGAVFYNPKTHFCQTQDDGETVSVMPKCDGETYRSNQFCGSDNVLRYKCQGADRTEDYKYVGGQMNMDSIGAFAYNVETEFCCQTSFTEFEDFVLLDKCGGETYAFDIGFCHNNQLYQRCGGRLDASSESENVGVYDPDYEFCDKLTIYDKCMTSQGLYRYNVDKEFCAELPNGSTEIMDLCGGKTYNPKVGDECRGGDIWKLCGHVEYNSRTQMCRNGQVINRL